MHGGRCQAAAGSDRACGQGVCPGGCHCLCQACSTLPAPAWRAQGVDHLQQQSLLPCYTPQPAAGTASAVAVGERSNSLLHHIIPATTLAATCCCLTRGLTARHRARHDHRQLRHARLTLSQKRMPLRASSCQHITAQRSTARRCCCSHAHPHVEGAPHPAGAACCGCRHTRGDVLQHVPAQGQQQHHVTG